MSKKESLKGQDILHRGGDARPICCIGKAHHFLRFFVKILSVTDQPQLVRSWRNADVLPGAFLKAMQDHDSYVPAVFFCRLIHGE